MLKVYDIKYKQEYIREVAILTQKEWGKRNISKQEFDIKIDKKIAKIKSNLDNPNYCKLILVDDLTLIGFTSIFEHDCNKRFDLSPWYSTMFVKKNLEVTGILKFLMMRY